MPDSSVFIFLIPSFLFWLGVVHKLRLQNLAFFDHLPPSVYIFYGMKVYKKSIFLTTYPPPLVNVVWERPLMLIIKSYFFVTKFDSSCVTIGITEVFAVHTKIPLSTENLTIMFCLRFVCLFFAVRTCFPGMYC